MYRRLFTTIFLANLAVAISFAVQKGKISMAMLASACLGNLTAAVVIRQEHFVNLLFRGFSSVPKSWPLGIRKYCAKIYSLGGVHSGCAVFAVVWLVWLTVDITVNFVSTHEVRHSWSRRSPSKAKTLQVSRTTLALAWILVVLLFLQAASAYPIFRQRFHNHFEMTHRFAGWLAVGLVWALVVSFTKDLQPPGSMRDLGRALVRTDCFWFLVVITASIIYPWLHLRKLAVRSEVLSSHAMRIFVRDRSYVNTHPGCFIRLSFDPLLEWHSFAAIQDSTSDRAADFSVVVSKAGDWTSHVIANPPTALWLRGVPSKHLPPPCVGCG